MTAVLTLGALTLAGLGVVIQAKNAAGSGSASALGKSTPSGQMFDILAPMIIVVIVNWAVHYFYQVAYNGSYVGFLERRINRLISANEKMDWDSRWTLGAVWTRSDMKETGRKPIFWSTKEGFYPVIVFIVSLFVFAYIFLVRDAIDSIVNSDTSPVSGWFVAWSYGLLGGFGAVFPLWQLATIMPRITEHKKMWSQLYGFELEVPPGSRFWRTIHRLTRRTPSTECS
jgi:hypothetical protein